MPKVDLARRLEIEDRRAEVLAMRLRKVTFADIAAHFGMSEMQIYRDYNAALKAHTENNLLEAGPVKIQNKQRLELLIERVLDSDDDKAPDRLMRAIDLLNKMYGVYGDNTPVQGNASANNNTLIIRYEQHTISVHKDSTQHTAHQLAADSDAAADAPMLVHGTAYVIDAPTDADPVESSSASTDGDHE